MASKLHGTLISLVISLLALYPALSVGVDLDYCAKLNTGSSFDSVVDGFQSIGACQKTCRDKYAFAILQGKTCWCSNAAPGNTVSTDNCNQNCPGYPDDKCGSVSEGLYGYIVLDKSPTTTIGSSSMTTSSVSSNQFSPSFSTITTRHLSSNTIVFIESSRSPVGETHSPALQSQSPAPQETDTQPQSTQMILTQIVQTTSRTTASSVTSTSTTKSSTTSTTKTSSSSSSSSSSSPTKSSSSTSVTQTASVTTIKGQITTITVPNGPVQTGSPSEGENSPPALTGGAIAGIIIGTLAAFGIFAAIILWFCCFRRRQQTKIDDGYRSPFHESPVPQPIFESTLSSRVPAMRSTPVNGATAGRRGSTARLSIPAFTDHRMKKDAMVYANGGRHSNVSLQDNQDYSRPVLRLTNPDPDDR